MGGRAFQELLLWDLPDDIKNQVARMSWNDLPITTGLSRWSMLRRVAVGWLRQDWALRGFLEHYGPLFGRVPVLHNIRLPDDLERSISDLVKQRFDRAAAPVVRLQIMYGGDFMPIHIDSTREASLVIPIMNHHGTYTRFYSSQDQTSILDPTRCQFQEEVEITSPTLIDTKQPHAVFCHKSYTKLDPRISITAKWTNAKYSELANMIL